MKIFLYRSLSFTSRPTEPFHRWVKWAAGKHRGACGHPYQGNPWPSPGAACPLLRAVVRILPKNGKRNIESRCFHKGLPLVFFTDTGQSSWDGRTSSWHSFSGIRGRAECHWWARSHSAVPMPGGVAVWHCLPGGVAVWHSVTGWCACFTLCWP